jgi:hypothetical protein
MSVPAGLDNAPGRAVAGEASHGDPKSRHWKLLALGALGVV